MKPSTRRSRHDWIPGSNFRMSDLISSDENWRIVDEVGEPFLLNDSVANVYFGGFTSLPDYQFMLYDGETVVATCNSIPLTWNLEDRTLSDAAGLGARMGSELKDRGATPNHPLRAFDHSRAQLSRQRDQQAGSRGHESHCRAARLERTVAPVRPSLKALIRDGVGALHPRTREDGTQTFDPWLRTHRRVGARIVKNCAALDVIPGTVAQWEDWTGMKFPESGE